MRFRRRIVSEVREKVAKLKQPKAQSDRTVLIHSGELDPTIEPSDYFDFIINADEWVAGLAAGIISILQHRVGR